VTVTAAPRISAPNASHASRVTNTPSGDWRANPKMNRCVPASA
jgi:hypothetical protein